MAKPPSLRDVARHAGVSLGTASRALNNKNNVLPETRASVLKAASELGYELQFRVPTAISTKLNTIGVVVKRDPGEHHRIDSFNYKILTGIEEECQRLGLSLMFSSIQVNEYSHATDAPPIFENDTIDGFVIVGAVLNDKKIVSAIPPEIPVAFADAYSNCCEFDSVQSDNFGGAYRAVSYLIELGHQNIGLIGSIGDIEEHPSIRQRRRAYLQALIDHGIKQSYIEEGPLNKDHAYEATQKLMQRAPHITAIFACNDDIALSALRSLHNMGYCVPDDVSVLGFDDTEAAQVSKPGLTTVYVDKISIGVLAVRLLYERATNMERVAVTTTLGTRLVKRGTVKEHTGRQVNVTDSSKSSTPPDVEERSVMNR